MLRPRSRPPCSRASIPTTTERSILAKTAASGLFDKLDKDGDSTLDHKEVLGRISEKEWAVADPDNDKTISKDEYLAYVEVLFKKADPDNDGTIDAKELSSPAGHALLRLLK